MPKNVFPYQQVRQFIVDQVQRVVWKPGECLPSEVDLAEQLNVHRLTINRVMRDLVRDGLLHRRRGVGTFVVEAKPTGRRAPFGDGLVGVLTGHDFNPVTNPYYGEMFEGLRRGLMRHGIYALPLGDISEYMELVSSGICQSLQKSLSGIALMGPADPEAFLFLESMKVPVAVLGVSEYDGTLPHVASDDCNDAGAVAKKMLALGHTNIVHLTRQLVSKLEGFLEACELDGHSVPFRYVLQANGFEIDDGRSAMHEFMNRDLPFTAVFGATDHLALGAMMALRERGLRVPEDVSVVGFDGLPARTPGLPRLSTMSVPRERIGEQAAELLANISKGRKAPASMARLPSEWISGETLGPARIGKPPIELPLAV